ncbi:hypothetical protein [Halocalculus aciditolerans]|uniref:hypothetical protein n=1 Tax=Halocalculus aciditolerans TaxID=1383812 RepID=UPI001662D162|nr:hypothetical protein [Halocalculus aciditolerans]
MEIPVSEDIRKKLKERAQKKGFSSTEEYCSEILRTVILELDNEKHDQKVQQRLEDLGYL